MTGEQVLAVDVGGTKLAAGLVDGEGRVIGRLQVPTLTGAGVDAEALWRQVAGLVRSVAGEATAPLSVCGVGCGGPMSPDGVSPLNIPAWRGFPLRERLAAATGLATFVDNDAKALALAEGWVGAARGEGNYLAMVVSTGIGGGIVLDRRLLGGRLGNAGHIGHVIVEPGGRRCGCGALGCLEAEASGLHLARRLGAPAAEAPPDVVERVGTLVGRAVASVCNLLDLRVAVVAGSVALGFGGPFFAAAQVEIDRCSRLDFSRGATIHPAGLGSSGPLVGAAAVGWSGSGRVLLGAKDSQS